MLPAKGITSPDADPLAALRSSPPPTTIERLRAFAQRIPPPARPWALAVGVSITVLVVGVVGLIMLAGRSAPQVGPAADEWPLPQLPSADTSTTLAPPPVGPELLVHAAGAVSKPGVYRLPGGTRVDDLLAAAGGLATDADHDRINRAAFLVDGQRVYITRVGEPDAPAVATETGSSPPPGPGQTGDTASGAGSLVDLNRATAQELEELPGVGPSIATAIVDHRETNGPFASVDDLLDVRGIGAARLEQLRDLVTV